jgi:hypothetical protein
VDVLRDNPESEDVPSRRFHSKMASRRRILWLRVLVPAKNWMVECLSGNRMVEYNEY